MGTKIVLLFIKKSILLHFLAYKFTYELKNDVIKLYNYAIQCTDILHRKWDRIKDQFNL